MSFINITDPDKRDKIVTEYLITLKKIQRKEDLNLSRISPTQLTESIKIKSNPDSFTQEPSKNIEEYPFCEKYLINKKNGGFDKYFGIESNDNGFYSMGDKEVIIDNNYIQVDNVSYKITSGLWSLITMVKPKNYNQEDMENYKKLLIQTKVITHPRNTTLKSRPKSTWKYKNILLPFLKEKENFVGGSVINNPIQYLPSNINSLKNRLSILLGEYNAGNRTSTRSEIITILDELLSRKRLSRIEYNEINTYLNQSL